MSEEEIIILKTILQDFINQYDKANTISCGMLPNGENVIYTKIKFTGRQKEFLKEIVDKLKEE